MSKTKKLDAIKKIKIGIFQIGKLIFGDEYAEAINKIAQTESKSLRRLHEPYATPRIAQLPDDVQFELSNRVSSAIISAYSELNDFITNDEISQVNVIKLNDAYRKTRKALKSIPDDIDIMFKDHKLNYKQIRKNTGAEIFEQNEKNYEASKQLLKKYFSTQANSNENIQKVNIK